MPLVQNGRPDPNLLTLCRKYGIDAPDDTSPIALNDQLQESWFKAGYLRYQIKGGPPSNEDWELLTKLGFTKEVPPPDFLRHTLEGVGEIRDRIYVDALVLGALRSRVVSRLHYLTQLIEHLKVKMVFLLGGARPLDTIKESREVLHTQAELPFKKYRTLPDLMPITEAGMMMLVVEQSVLPMGWHYYVVDAALQLKVPTNPEGEKRPPNTAETVLTLFDPQFRSKSLGTIWHYIWQYQEDRWERVNLPALPFSTDRTTYLAVSNQPFVEYQRLAVQRAAPPGTTIIGCGHAASPTLPLATFLDNIAKQLFEELRAPSRS